MVTVNSAGFPDYVLSGNGVEIPFNSGTPDTNGCYWYMDGEMAGWDSPDGRVTMLTKIGSGPNADGEYPADQHYRGRTLTFTLYASCPSEVLREAARYLLAQVLDLIGTTGVLQVNEEIPKSITISRSGNNNQGKLVMTDSGLSTPPVSTPGFPPAVATDEDNLIKVLKAEIEVYAQDPRKYIVPYFGPDPIEDNAITMVNEGNTACTNFFILMTGDIEGITGPLSITVTNGDNVQTMVLVVPVLPAGAPALNPFPTELGLNFYTNTILDGDGNDYYYLRDLQSPWLVLLPGTNVITFDPPSGSVDGSGTWYAAWI